MNNEVFSRVILSEYYANNDEDCKYKGIVKYFDKKPTEDIMEFNNMFCERLVDNLTPELARWHYTQNIPLATFYYNENKSNIYLHTPYAKYLEYDEETISNAETVIDFYNGTSIRAANGDIISADELEKENVHSFV